MYGPEHAHALAHTIHQVLSRARSRLETPPAVERSLKSPQSPQPEALVAQTRRGDAVAEGEFFHTCERLELSVRLLRRVAVWGESVDAAEGDVDGAENVTVYSITLGSSRPLATAAPL